MSQTEWTRAHDCLLAERCDNWNWVAGPAPNYSTDLVAVVRAAEAWRKQDEERRTWLLRAQCIAGEDEFVARMDNDVTTAGDHRHAASTPAAALAWALWKAVQG